MNESPVLFPHASDPAVFREALAGEEANTGFTAELIEKDYFCSLVIRYLQNQSSSHLVFKGGTCFSKVYTDFYRLSEDLDFVIPVDPAAARNRRRKLVQSCKKAFDSLTENIPGMSVREPLIGHFKSRQYTGMGAYDSVVLGRGTVKIEIGLREDLLRSPAGMLCKTLLNNPYTGRPLLPPFSVITMDYEEAYAEKVRAALTRKEPVVRDYYDLFYAITNGALDYRSRDFIDLVRKKIAVPGNDPVRRIPAIESILRQQARPRLQPVLRPKDFETFDFDVAGKMIRDIYDLLNVE